MASCCKTGNRVSLMYTRPKHQDTPSVRPDSSASSTVVSFSEDDSDLDKADSVGSGHHASSIPPALSFNRIVNGGTCSPCTLRDFMNFLIYIEHSAENLQFFLWLRDYDRRFRTASSSDIALSPEWSRAHTDEVLAQIRRDVAGQRRREPEIVTQVLKGTDFDADAPKLLSSTIGPVDSTNPFRTPPLTPSGTADQESVYTASNATYVETINSQASDSFAMAGARQPFTVQPFRHEINRIIATYIAEGAPRQLNLSGPERIVTMHALSCTTHPSAFAVAFKPVVTTLRRQAHPNFIRWSISNGNRPRVYFARILGLTLIAISTLAAVLLTLSRANRGYRALAAIGWFFGISTLIAAYKGMCVVLHGMHHHHVRPWELFGEDLEEKRSFDSFGSENSYEDKPWVVKYQKRNFLHKVFDRERWVQEPALRQIQDVIFVQSILGALAIAGALTVLFVLLPSAHNL